MARFNEHLSYVMNFLILGSTFLVAKANDKPILPNGACNLKNGLIDELRCSPGFQFTYSMDVYVSDQTFCQHSSRALCFTCTDGAMTQQVCSDLPAIRQIRAAIRRGSRTSSRHRSRLLVEDNVRRGRMTSPRRNRTSSDNNYSRRRVFSFTTGSRTSSRDRSRLLVEDNVRRGRITSPRRNRTFSDNNYSRRRGSGQSRSSRTGSRDGSRVRVPINGRRRIYSSNPYRTSRRRGTTGSRSRRIIRCPAPSDPTNGFVKCPSTTSTVYGTKCTFSCNTGYQLIGPATATCQNSAVFTPSPTCQKIQCGNPPVPSNAKSVSCSDGNSYQSVCSPVCSQGYLPSRGARSVCSANKKWTSTSWTCEDTEKPGFTSCPSKKINTLDKRFKWIVTATDNSGSVTLKQVQGHPSGSLVDFGVYFIKYLATDAANNSAVCVFTVEYKVADCPRPVSEDKDIKFTCNGLTSQSVCHLSCTSGSFVQGSKYIACAQSSSGNNTSYWQPIDGEKAKCYKRTCPTLSPPKNGALACDKQLGGTVCQIQCDDRFDVAPGEGTRPTYICGNSGIWTPSSVVPDCLEIAFPDEYSLPTELFYFIGDCSDAQALDIIKQQFIDNLKSIGLSPCISDTCSVEDIQVTCGEDEAPTDFSFRIRRSTNPAAKGVLRVRFTFHVKNSNRTLSPEEASTLLKSLANKSKRFLSTNMATSGVFSKLSQPSAIASSRRPAALQARLPFAASSRPIMARSFIGNLTAECAVGYGQAISKSGVCVPCSVGTYSDMKGHTCRSCPVTSYQDKAGSTSCRSCPVNHTTLSKRSATRASCLKMCEKDTFSSTGVVPCFPCPAGTHQPEYGAKTCVACPENASQRLLQCSNIPQEPVNDTNIQYKLLINKLMLTCEREVCLSF